MNISVEEYDRIANSKYIEGIRFAYRSMIDTLTELLCQGDPSISKGVSKAIDICDKMYNLYTI